MSSKSPKSKCFDKFDLNESTCKFVKKCDPGKVRNKDFRCVKEKKSNLTEFLEDIKIKIDKLNTPGAGAEEKKKRAPLRGALTKAKKQPGLTEEQIKEIEEAIEYAKLPSANSIEKQQLNEAQTTRKQANKTARKEERIAQKEAQKEAQTAQKQAKLAELAARVAERRREAENTQNKPTKTKKTLKDRKAAATRKRSSSSGSSRRAEVGQNSGKVPVGISLNGSSISSVVSVLKNAINRFSRSNSGSRTPGSRSSSLRSSSSRSSGSLSQSTQSK